MKFFYITLLIVLFSFVSCHQQERNCKNFRNGVFEFTATINGEEKTTRFIRNNSVEIDYFENKADTSSIQWINDCEYILRKVNPKNNAEKKAIHIKILTTSKNTYIFEYGEVGKVKKKRGIAKKNN